MDTLSLEWEKDEVLESGVVWCGVVTPMLRTFRELYSIVADKDAFVSTI